MRAVFGLKVPVVAAIGHERDVTLAELSADVRASTPSNAAEQVVPDKVDVIQQLKVAVARQYQALTNQQQLMTERVNHAVVSMSQQTGKYRAMVEHLEALLHSYNPKQILERGYSITRTTAGVVLTSTQQSRSGDEIETVLADGSITSTVL